MRVQPGRVRLLLSDVTASAEWDLAEQVLNHLGLDVPEGDELDEVRLSALTRRLGFGERYERVVDALSGR